MKKILSMFLLCFFALNVSISGFAIDLNDSSVYFKQTGKYCTLDSMAMIFRRKAILDGNKNWKKITEATMLKQGNWPSGMAGSPVYYDADSGLNMKATSKKLYDDSKGDNSNTSSIISTLKTNLDAHPEGIVLYVFQSGGWQHAVALTRYDSAGNFYCADPGGSSSGIINLMDSILVDSAHANTSSLNELLKHSVKIWWVSNSSNDSSSEESETDNRPVAPSVVTVSSLAGDTIEENENFKISWNNGKNATKYEICIRSLPTMNTVHYSSVNSLENSYTYNLPVGYYEVAVITVNSNLPTSLGVNYDYSVFVEFEVKEIPRPVAPSKVEVSAVSGNNITENESFKISWNAGKNVTEYAVCIRSLSSKEVIHYKGDIDPSVNSYIYNLPVGQYDVAVITVNSDFPTSLGVNYNYSESVEFEVKENIAIESTVTKSGAKLIVDMKVHNFEEPYDIFIAGYKENKFVTLKRIAYNEQNSPYTLEGDIDEIKVMVWNNLIPICEAEIIPESEWLAE